MWKLAVDEASKQSYYWNTVTEETAWELPEGARLAPSVSLASSPSGPSPDTPSGIVGTLDRTTGAFTTAQDPSELFDPKRRLLAKADRQMSAYFDTQAYQDSRQPSTSHSVTRHDRTGKGSNSNKQNRVTKKDIQRFKAKKEEKKRAKLIKAYKDE